MTISELIERLEKAKAQMGDANVSACARDYYTARGHGATMLDASQCHDVFLIVVAIDEDNDGNHPKVTFRK